MTFLRKPRPRGTPVLLLVLAAVLLACLPPLVVVYGKSDDFNFLADARNGSMRLDQNPFVEGGRPVLALAMVAGFGACHSVGDLRLLRAVALLGTLLFVAMVFRWARRHGWSAAAAGALAALAVLNIGWAVFVGWAACFSYPWAAMLGFLVGCLSWRAGGAMPWPRRAGLLALGVLCLLVTLCIYQPCAGFALLPPVVALLGGAAAPWPFALPFAAYMGSSALYLGGFVMVKRAMGWAGETAARSAIGLDPMRKIDFAARDIALPLLEGWGGIVRGPGAWLYAALTALLLAAFFLNRRQGCRGLKFCAGLAAVGLAALPLVILASPYAPYRTLAVPFAILAAFAAAGVDGLLPRPGPARALAFAAVVGIGAASFAFWTWDGLVRPRAAEWRALRSLVASSFSKVPSFLIFRPPQFAGENPCTIAAMRHEYGAFDTVESWIPEAMMNVIAADIVRASGREPEPRDWKRIGVAMVAPGDAADLAGYPVVDANAALFGRPQPPPAATPGLASERIGPYARLANWEWCFSPALGYFRSWDLVDGRPVGAIFHPRFGPLKFVARKGGNIVFKGAGGTLVVFKESLYPDAAVRSREGGAREIVSLKGPFDLP